jgi:hypothetical protein
MARSKPASAQDVEAALEDLEALRAEREKFWRESSIPVNENWKEDETSFANPVEVADMFVRATGVAAQLATEAEELTEAIANAEYLKDDANIEYMRLRRQILSQNFGAIKSGWNSEALEAFILACAKGQEPTLLKLEKDVENATRAIRVRKPRLEKLKNRLKRLETSMDWAKSWLDYEKLMQRVTSSASGRRV